MATMQSRDTRTFVAGEDLSAAQFKFVTLEAGNVVDLADSAGENCVGVLLVEGAANAIIGTSLDDAAMDKLAATASAACNPISDKRGTVEFRTKIAGVLAKRAAKIAYDRAKG